MSQYVHFFVRHENDFLPIANYSRSNYLYSIYNNYLPYEKIKPLTKDILFSLSETIRKDIKEFTDEIAKYEQQKNFVKECNNSLSEKMETLAELNEIINEYKESLEERNYALNFTYFLQEMCESAYDTKYNSNEEIHLDSDTYIYGGIEIGCPTMEDLA